MKLPLTSEYALRIMVYMADRSENTGIRATDISKQTKIPVHYLSKVLRQLVNFKILSAQKGHGGGFVISKPLSKISFKDILRAVGHSFSKNHCAFGYAKCDDKNPCLLHDSWSELNNSFLKWAEKKNLKNI